MNSYVISTLHLILYYVLPVSKILVIFAKRNAVTNKESSLDRSIIKLTFCRLKVSFSVYDFNWMIYEKDNYSH